MTMGIGEEANICSESSFLLSVGDIKQVHGQVDQLHNQRMNELKNVLKVK